MHHLLVLMSHYWISNPEVRVWVFVIKVLY